MDCKVAILRSLGAQFTRGGLGMAKDSCEEDTPPEKLRRAPSTSVSFLSRKDSRGQFVACLVPGRTRTAAGAGALVGVDRCPATAPRVRCSGSLWQVRMRSRLGVGPTAFLARGGASHGGLRSQLCKHGGNGWPDSALPRYRCSSLLFRLWAVCLPGVCVGWCPTVWVHGPTWLTPGAVYTRELASLGTSCVDGLVIGKGGERRPAVEAGNECELLCIF